MSDMITDPKMISALQDLGRGLKTPSDLAKLNKELLKITVEASLNAEMDAHLGYNKHSPEGYNTGNSRNGYNRKTLKGDHGELEIATPRDRKGEFEPIFVAKNQTRLTKFDDQILMLYAKGMTTRDIVETFAELYGADISPALVSQVTDSVLEKSSNGNRDLWMLCIRFCIWIALSLKSVRTSESLTKPSMSRWA